MFFRIQTEFMQMQLNAFGEQAKSLGDAFTKWQQVRCRRLSKRFDFFLRLERRENRCIALGGLCLAWAESHDIAWMVSCYFRFLPNFCVSIGARP
jgi:hypothetical protein